VTNAAFRTLCRAHGGGLFVSEMVMARALLGTNERTRRMVAFGPDESPRSVQLYTVDPHVTGLAVQHLVEEVGVDHVDLNFGCPAAKVTRKGGGAALPLHGALLASIVAAAVAAAGPVPVTVKLRIGVDDRHRTVPRRRPDGGGGGRGGGAPPRPHRRAALLGCGRLVGHRRAEGGGHDRARPRQRRHLGGGRRRRHDGGDRL
jgi:tRNA-dihydrouridine synthase